MAILERHEEEIESILAKNPNDIVSKICNDLSNACTNVNRSEKLEKPDVDVTIDGDTKKAEFEYEMDPQTGKAKKSEEKIENEPKTLSKKDRKSKKAKKEKSKSKAVEEKKKSPVDYFQLDLNDPDSMNKVMAQIKEATDDHSKEFYSKREKEEAEKEEEEERKMTEAKDEL